MSDKKVGKIFDKAKQVVTDNEKVKALLSEVKSKLDKIGNDSEERSSFLYQIQVVVRMLKAHFSGSYRAFSTTSVVTLVFALVYFVTPVDLIPDFIPALGLTDDISLVYLVLRNLAEDVERFRLWEQSEA